MTVIPDTTWIKSDPFGGASKKPSGVKLIHSPPAAAIMLASSAPVCEFQMATEPSSCLENMRLPSGENARDANGLIDGSSRRRTWVPVLAFHRLPVPSGWPPVTTNLPSGEQAVSAPYLTPCGIVLKSLPLFRSQTESSYFECAEMIRWLSAEKTRSLKHALTSGPPSCLIGFPDFVSRTRTRVSTPSATILPFGENATHCGLNAVVHSLLPSTALQSCPSDSRDLPSGENVASSAINGP